MRTKSFVAVALHVSIVAAFMSLAGCHRSTCDTPIREGERFRITVVSVNTRNALCTTMPALPVGTSYIVVAGAAEDVGPDECTIRVAASVSPSPPFASDELTSCQEGTNNGQLGFVCTGTDPSGCSTFAQTFVDLPFTHDGSPLGILYISWTLPDCGTNGCNESYNVTVDDLGVADGGSGVDGAVDVL